MKLTPLCIRLIARIAVAICERKTVPRLCDFPRERLLPHPRIPVPRNFRLLHTCFRSSHNAFASTATATTRLSLSDSLWLSLLSSSSNWYLISMHFESRNNPVFISIFMLHLQNIDLSFGSFIYSILESYILQILQKYVPSYSKLCYCINSTCVSF